MVVIVFVFSHLACSVGKVVGEASSVVVVVVVMILMSIVFVVGSLVIGLIWILILKVKKNHTEISKRSNPFRVLHSLKW